jgi:hypothetical protein
MKLPIQAKPINRHDNKVVPSNSSRSSLGVMPQQCGECRAGRYPGYFLDGFCIPCPSAFITNYVLLL